MASAPSPVMSRGAKSSRPGSGEPIDQLSSSTLKRHPKMDLNKTDMLQLLSYLEGELQARDVVIATLKAEKAKHFLYEAKYGRFGGLGDHCQALQRDSELNSDTSFDEAAVRSMYDDQLTQLDNLITTQHRAQQKMREQLNAIDKRYHKVCVELEEEKAKHARDMEQGDNVTYMLEKDRERLKQELEFEKSQNKKLDRELKRVLALQEEESASSAKHQQVALMLIRGRARLVHALTDLKARCAAMESTTKEAHRLEAANEEHQVEVDFEREQLRARLARAEAQNRDLRIEIDRLRGPGTAATARPTAAHPHVYISERTVSPTPPQLNPADIRRAGIPAVQKLSPEADSATSRIVQATKKSPLPHETAINSSLSASAEIVAKMSANASHVMSSSPAVAAALAAPRKLAPAGRGGPPPIPPNKPQVVIPPQGSVPRPISGVSSPPSKFVSVPKDRISVPVSDGVANIAVINRAPSPRLVSQPVVGLHSTPVGRPDVSMSTAVRKSAPTTAAGQVCVNLKSQVG